MKELQFYTRPNDAFDSALFAMTEHCYLSYDGMDFHTEGSPKIILESFSNQEAALIRKDLVSKLSSDALFVVNAIQDEASEIQTPKTGNITARSIKQFLEKNHWGKTRIKKTFKEIQGFVLQLPIE